MNREKLIVGSVLFLAIGLAWIISYWNGSIGFNAAHPIAGSVFSMNITVTGWPALGGVLLSLLGALLLLFSGVVAVIDIASARRG